MFGALETTQALMLIVGLAIAGAFGNVVGIVTLLSADSALYVLAGALALLLLPRPPRMRERCSREPASRRRSSGPAEANGHGASDR